MGFEDFKETPPVPEEPEKAQEAVPNQVEEGESFRVDSLAESIRKIGSVLAKRESDGLNALIDRGGVGSFFSLSTALGESVTGNKDSIAELKDIVPRLNQTLDQFGKVPPERIVRENTESLKYLSRALRGFSEEALTLKSLLGSKEKEEYAEVIRGLNRAIDRSEKISLWLRKKADILEGRGRY